MIFWLEDTRHKLSAGPAGAAVAVGGSTLDHELSIWERLMVSAQCQQGDELRCCSPLPSRRPALPTASAAAAIRIQRAQCVREHARGWRVRLLAYMNATYNLTLLCNAALVGCWTCACACTRPGERAGVQCRFFLQHCREVGHLCAPRRTVSIDQ